VPGVRESAQRGPPRRADPCHKAPCRASAGRAGEALKMARISGEWPLPVSWPGPVPHFPAQGRLSQRFGVIGGKFRCGNRRLQEWRSKYTMSGSGRAGRSIASCLFPSPLVGEGGSNERSEFETGEGLRPIDGKRPLTQLNAWLTSVMPSPTRGEGAAISAHLAHAGP
jgi:hypothetical protein